MTKWPVLLLVESLSHGGCERDAAKIAVGLDRSRFEPHVAVFHTGGFRSKEVEGAGVPILALPVRSFLNSSMLQGARLLREYIRSHHIQLVHSFDVPTSIFVAPVARWYKVPVVITSQLSYRNMYSHMRQIALRLTDALSDRVVVNSRAVGESLQHLSPKRLHLCYNGVNPDEFSPGPGIRPFGEGSLVVGTVCVMREEKRVDWVIRSFAEVYRSHPDLRLLLVGSGAEIKGLKTLCETLGLANACRFEPAQANIADWMRGIDLYINSSRSESFPNALLEAMACGCCVLGSSVGGIPELITHGEDGLVFDAANRADLTQMMALAVTDRALREKMRQRAAVTAHCRFSMSITLQSTEMLYQTLLESRGRSLSKDGSGVC
jgi:glycosyltransferase involved in cell wall biosynthesis